MADLDESFELESVPKEFYQQMDRFRRENLYCDVVLNVNGKRFPCHRLILTAMSGYFKTLFDGDYKDSNSPVLDLNEIEPEIMELILDTIYTARNHLTPRKVYPILKTSHFLRFESIVNVCIDYIKNNHQIYYLIDIYYYAKRLALHKLRDICIQALADDFIHWGKTDEFKDLQFEDLNVILSHTNAFAIKDEIFFLIIKWSKSNNVNAKNICTLLQSAKLENRMMGPAAVAQFIVTGESEIVKAFDEKNTEDNDVEMNTDFSINLYMKFSHVKTGAKGWGVLQVNDTLDQYNLSDYYSSDDPIQNVCRIGTKLYCLEKDNVANRCIFSYYEDGEKTHLNEPIGLIFNANSKSHDYPAVSMVQMKNFIYLSCKEDKNIWSYNCELNEWGRAFEQRPQSYSVLREAMHDCPLTCDRVALTTLDDVLYVIGSKKIISFDSRTPTARKISELQRPLHHNCGVCSFDGKIFLSGSNHDHTPPNTFLAFDVRSNRYMNLKTMNSGRAHHKLIRSGDFMYAIENSPFATTNEKYHINSNTWIELPSLPKHMSLKLIDGTSSIVATGFVINADIADSV